MGKNEELQAEVERYQKGIKEMQAMVDDMTDKYITVYKEAERLRSDLESSVSVT